MIMVAKYGGKSDKQTNNKKTNPRDTGSVNSMENNIAFLSAKIEHTGIKFGNIVKQVHFAVCNFILRLRLFFIHFQ